MGSAWESIKVDGSSMRTYVSAPDDSKRMPGIVIVEGQSGVDDFLEFSRMVSRQGYDAAPPDMFHRDPPYCKDDGPTRRARLRDQSVIQDINAAVSHLKNHPQVDAGRIGIVGFCMGGRVVCLMAAVNADIKAGGDVLRQSSVQCLGRWIITIRADKGYSLPDHGPFR